MGQIVRSLQAEQDLETTLDYLDSQSTQAADRFAKRFDESCDLHATFPQLGASSEELAPGLRHFTVGNYVVFYRPITEGIEIIRIIHGARDLPRFFE
jgi:toxin ParE1/3/4